MKVDVVIPAYNSAPWLGDAIESVLKQTLRAERIIVVDDGSTDNTNAVVARFHGRVQVIRHAVNRGPSAARNSGICAGNSELIAFLDADDVWTPEKLEKQLGEFKVSDPPGLSYTSLIDCDMQLKPLERSRKFKRRIRESVFDELFLDAFPIPPSVLIVRRTAFDLCGLFDETMLKAEDYECCLRIAMRSSISCIAEPLCLRRNNPGSITATSGFEKDVYYSCRAFDLCGKAAATARVDLPMSVEERKILFLRRRYWESILWHNKERQAFYADKLFQTRAYTTKDHLMSTVLRCRAGVCRVLARLIRQSVRSKTSKFLM